MSDTPNENTIDPNLDPSANPGGAPEIPAAEPPKKRRGRPPKNPNLSTESIPAGEKTAKPKAKKVSYSAEDLTVMGRQLVGLHQMAAVLMGAPEMMLQEQEGQMLAQSIVTVAEEYGLSMDGKTGAAVQLLGTAAMIYVPRALAIRNRMAQQRSANVVDVAPSQAG